jgi:hypothetical protein
MEGEDDFIAEPASVYPEMTDICRNLYIAVMCALDGDITDHVFAKIPPGCTEFKPSPLQVTVPVVPSLRDLATVDSTVRCRDFACFVAKEKLVLARSQSADELLTDADDLDSKMVGMVSKLLPSPLLSRLTNRHPTRGSLHPTHANRRQHPPAVSSPGSLRRGSDQ